MRAWMMTACAAGTLIFACGQATAKPVVSGDFTSEGGIVVLPEIEDGDFFIPGTPAEFDIDGDGVADIRVAAFVDDYFEPKGVCVTYGAGVVTALSGGMLWECSHDYIEFFDFNNGDLIGPVLDYNDPDNPFCPQLADHTELYHYGIAFSPFYDGSGGTIGFSFVSNDQTHWGWMEIIGGQVECGAVAPTILSYGYETTPGMPVLAHAPTCNDLTGDTLVDSADLNVLLGAFGQSDEGDLDGDGMTTSADLNIILADFGAGCEALGSCCIGGECEHLTIDECGAAGGTFVGNQVACDGASCG